MNITCDAFDSCRRNEPGTKALTGRKAPVGMQKKEVRGFTLLEILIALFIFAIVLSTLFTSYSGTFTIMGDTEFQADMYGKARTVLARMQEDLESIHFSPGKKTPESIDTPPPPTRFVGEAKEIDGRKADGLRFSSTAHLVFDEEDQNSGTAEIRYEVREAEGEALELYRVDTPRFEEAPEAGTGGLLLCDGLYSVKFTYFDREGSSYESWDSTDTDATYEDKLPAVVNIVLEFLNEQNPEAPFRFMTAVALPMAGEENGKTQ